MTRTAIVVGAGIAGLAAAAGLARRGWDVTAIEQSATRRADGAGLTLWPNALRALDAVGLGEAVRAIGHPIGRAVVRTPGGRELTELPIARLAARHGPLVTVYRPELHDVLAGQFRGSVNYSAAATAAGGQLCIGGDRARADLIIGADGINSTVRRVLLGTVNPRPAAQFAARGVALTGDASHVMSETWGRGLRFGIVPLSGGRTYWFAATTCRASAEDPAGTFARWHAPIASILSAPPVGSTPVLALADLPLLRTWHDGRSIVLVGDAAHAMTPNLGQGAAQALADVAILLAELDAQPVPAALAAYQLRRKRSAERIVSRSRIAGRMAQGTNPAVAVLRDGLARVTPARLALRQAEAVVAG